jgi:hypothetical protein
MSISGRIRQTLVAVLFSLGCCGSSHADVLVRGRVVDADGLPVAGADVQPVMVLVRNSIDPRSTMLQTRTDEEGRFVVNVPFAEMLCWVIVSDHLTGNVSEYFISGEATELSLQFKDRPTQLTPVQGSVVNTDGTPARGLKLRLYDSYGSELTTTTADDGSFEFTKLNSENGQLVIVTEGARDALPMRLIRPRDGPQRGMKLVEHGIMSGTLTDLSTQAPVAGAVVSVHPTFGNSFARKTISDANGQWTMFLPPGAYRIEVESSTHFLRDPLNAIGGGARGAARGRQADLIVNSGVATEVPMSLSPRARIAGNVVDDDGKPLEGAVITLPSLPRTIYDPSGVGQFRSDKDGNFTASTGQLGAPLTLNIFHGVGGIGSVQLQPLAEGELREISPIQLHGSARVRGTVSDESGAPAEGITLNTPLWASSNGSGIRTDAAGTFDLGRFPLSPKADDLFEVSFESPRPGAGSHFQPRGDSFWHPTSQRIDRVFYRDAKILADLKREIPVDMKVTLKRADLLTFQGRIAEPDGTAPAVCAVYVFSGAADEQTLSNHIPGRSGGFIVLAKGVKVVGAGECDAEGNYKVYALRQDGEAVDPQTTRFSIGIATQNRPRKVVTEIRVDSSRKDISNDITLDPAPPEESARGARRGVR